MDKTSFDWTIWDKFFEKEDMWKLEKNSFPYNHKNQKNTDLNYHNTHYYQPHNQDYTHVTTHPSFHHGQHPSSSFPRSHTGYHSHPENQFSRQPFGQDPRQPFGQDPRQPFGQDPRQPFGQDPRQPFGQDPRQASRHIPHSTTPFQHKHKQTHESNPSLGFHVALPQKPSKRTENKTTKNNPSDEDSFLSLPKKPMDKEGAVLLQCIRQMLETYHHKK